MFKTVEFRRVPYGALILLIIEGLFLQISSVDGLISFLDGLAVIWQLVIVTLVTTCISDSFGKEGSGLRHAFFGNGYNPSLFALIRNLWISIGLFWLVFVAYAAFLIYKNAGLEELLQLWKAIPIVLFSVLVTIAAMHIILSVSLFTNFYVGWLALLFLFWLSDSRITFNPDSVLSILNFDDHFPFPAFDVNMEEVHHWPTYNAIAYGLSFASLPFAYHVWQQKQWYLRKA